VASDLPAHADLISNGKNGWLVESRETLAAALYALSDPQSNRLAGEAAREQARREIGDWQQAGARFRAAYRSVVES
jgi:hypothetical protein